MLSLSHLLLVVIVVFVIFGAGKFPRMMGDIGKGIRNLREELSAKDEHPKQEVLPPEEKK